MEHPEKFRIYLLLCLQCVTISFNVAAIAAAIPAISRDLALSDIRVAQIIPFYMIPYGIGALIYAPLAKTFSFRRIMAWTMGVFAAASYSCTLDAGFGTFLIFRVLMGLSGASAIPLGLILIGRIFPKEVRGRLVGIFFSCSFVSSIAGIALSGTAHWRWLFVIPAFLASLSAGFAALSGSGHLRPMGGKRIDYGIIFRRHHSRDVFIFIFLISMLFHAVHKWLGVYLSRIYQMDQPVISLFFIFMALGGVAGQMLGGIITDGRGRYEACILGIVVLGFSAMALAGIYPVIVLGLILVAFQAGWTIGHNGVSTVLTDFPDDNRAEVASLNSSLRFLSGGAGFFVSRIFVKYSFGFTFLGCGILLLILAGFVKKIIPKACQ